MQSTNRTSSSSSFSSSAAASFASTHDFEDGKWLYQLSCVETFMPLAADVTPVEEDDSGSSEHPVAKLEHSPNFSSIYGVYRSLRNHLIYTPMIPSPGQRCGYGELSPVIQAIHTSAARWFLLLAFALRQCTSNYTVWKDRRDVLMSPTVLEQATRDALPDLPVPAAILSRTTSDAEKQTALRELDERQEKLRLTSQHWLPARADIAWEGRISPWRAVHWELTAVGCFTRLYHKNFQLWHHRKELLMYALEQSPSHHECDGVESRKTPLLATQETFSDYLRRHHGLDFADVDERPTLHVVLGNEDGKNYHAWLHLSWYLHVFSFLVTPPSQEALRRHAEVKTDAVTSQGEGLCFTACSNWIASSEGAEAMALHPTLPSSPLTDELQFTAQLIYRDCRNNSAWCHRLALLREALVRRLWRQLCSGEFRGAVGTPSPDEDWQCTVRVICSEELDYSIQWLYVDPTNEAAYTHARSVSLLYHTLTTRRHVWAAERAMKDGSEELQRYLADAPLITPVALAHSQLCSNAEAGTVFPSTHVLHLLGDRQRRVPWGTYVESFSLLHYMQRALDTVIRPRAAELEEQAARILHSTAANNARTFLGQAPKPQAIAALNSLYERSSQYMLDNLHQVDTAQYSACQAKLEEMWLTYMDAAQRRRVQQLRPPEAYREGIRPEWLEPYPWCEPEKSVTGVSGQEYHPDAAVLDFIAYEAAAVSKAKQLTLTDPIRLKYWKGEVLNVIFRSYGPPA
ncbi:hypothetical protein JKF63_00479 [Porcisia hertigi]|uniref:Protein farnesyltransferase/geranylgeranyltransferase type-1 subunit alpha n=1 Tax=Porcisia hertigi TaxID=2761500 RepID=A0A836HF68_9TRYP|nr:hypothetical protein JKF63_00479 [Porcisia hertigi]